VRSHGSPHPFFNKKNFLFATYDQGRGAPTLYFQKGNKTGRIRLVHDDGPAIKEDVLERHHHFCVNTGARDLLVNQLENGQAPAQSGTPTDNTYHVEEDVWAGGTVIHESGGLVRLIPDNVILSKVEHLVDAVQIAAKEDPETGNAIMLGEVEFLKKHYS
jgi:hypothetical protein